MKKRGRPKNPHTEYLKEEKRKQKAAKDATKPRKNKSKPKPPHQPPAKSRVMQIYTEWLQKLHDSK